MSWCPICMLIGLLLFYLGGTVTVVVVVSKDGNLSNPGTAGAIVIIITLTVLMLAGIMYYLVRSCYQHEEQRILPQLPVQQHIIDIPMSINTPSGTSIIQHPTGELQLGITK